MLVAADGALSRLARSLGIVTTPPDAVCSRAYVRAGTDRCTADGLVFYPRFLLPGYCGVVREADGDLNFCCYVIPGGSTAPTDLRAVHEWLVSSDPEVSAVLGPDAKIDRMQAAPLRLGGVPRSYGPNCLVLGDAAGQIMCSLHTSSGVLRLPPPRTILPPRWRGSLNGTRPFDSIRVLDPDGYYWRVTSRG